MSPESTDPVKPKQQMSGRRAMRRSRSGRSPRRYGRALTATLLAVLAATVMAVAAPSASAAPFQCDAFGYLFQTPTGPPTTMDQVDLVTGEVTDLGTVSPSDGLNAVGYNIKDGFFYAYDFTAKQVVKVNSDRSLTPVPTPAALPTSSVVIGDVDPNGHYWTLVEDQYYEIDYSDPSSPAYGSLVSSGASATPPGLNVGGADWAWIGGFLYRLPRDEEGHLHLVRFDPATGNQVDLGSVAVTATNVGAVYADAAGFLYGSDNGSGQIFRVNPANGDAIKVTDGPSSNRNDGARCATAPIPTITVTKAVGGRIRSSDQFTVGLQNEGGQTVTSATTEGTATTISTTNFPVSQGDTYTITDAMAAGSGGSIGEYMRSIACTNAEGEPVPTGGSASAWTILVDEPTNYACTVTNVGEADLSIEKTAKSSPAIPGGDLTYELVVENHGPSNAAGVKVTDPLPAGLSFVSGSQGCAEAGGTVTCSLASLADGASHAFTITTHVGQGVTGTIDNVGQVTGETPDPEPGNDESETETPAAPEADISLEKKATSSPAIPGADLTYELVVENHGPAVAPDVKVTDALPAGLTFVSGSQGCTEAGGTVTCSLASLGVGQSHTFTVTTHVGPGVTGTIVNGAQGESGVPDHNPGNEHPETETPVAPEADLSIVKTAKSSPAIPGTDLTYELVVENHGPSNAAGVRVTDALPAGLSFVSASQGCTEAGGTVTCSLATLAAGASHAFTVTTHVAPGIVGTIDNVAKVTGETPDHNPGNDESETETPAAPEADISLEKKATSSPAIPGKDLTYELVVENHGPAVAPDVKVTDPLPAGLSFVSASQGCTEAGGTVTCSLATLGVGQSHTFTVTTHVGPGVTGTIVNGAQGESGIPDHNPGNEHPETETPVAPEADLSIVKQAKSSPAIPGEDLTYELVVENHGPSNAAGVKVTDALPAGLSFVSASQGCTEAGGTVTCSLAALAAGGTQAFTVTVHVAPGIVGAIVNVAKVTGETPDPEPGNDESESETPVEPRSDLSIVKQAKSSPAIPGTDLTYELVVENHGPSNSPGGKVTDPLPTGLSFVSGSQGCKAEGGTVTCSLGALAVGGSHAFTVVTHVGPGVTGKIANVGKVTGDNPDPEPGNDESESETPVEPRSDLSIVKKAKSSPAIPGTDLTYELVVENHGPSNSPGGKVTDHLPAGLSVASASQGCKAGGTTVTCALAALAVGQSQAFTVTVHVGPGVTGTIVNVGKVTGHNPDPEPGNDEGKDETPTSPRSDLSLTKKAKSSPAIPGTDLTYELVVENHGPSKSPGGEVTDPLPAGLSFVSGSGGCKAGGTTVTCALAALAVGQSQAFTITVHVGPGVTGTIANVAKVTGDNPDPEGGDDTSEVKTPTAVKADLSIEKKASARKVRGGRRITYTLAILNHGPGNAAGVKVNDRLRRGLTLVAARPSQGNCSAGPKIGCDLGSLAAGGSARILIIAKVDKGYTGALKNKATVTADSPDPNLDNNHSEVKVVVKAGYGVDAARSSNRPLLRLVKTGPKAVRAGHRVRFHLKVTNLTSRVIRRVTVCDRLPAGLAFVATRSHARLAAGSRCWKIGKLGPHRSKRLVVVARALRGARGKVRNTAVAHARGSRSVHAHKTVRVIPIPPKATPVTG